MPWNDNPDQGSKPGSKPGRNPGPWGASPPTGPRDDEEKAPRPPRPDGPRRPSGPTPPGDDLAALARRLRARIESLLGAHPGGVSPPRLLASLLLAAACIWVASGLYVVQPSQQAVVTTFGAFSRETGPGLNYHLPSPIERVEKVSVTSLNRVDIGGSSAGELPEESLMLTGDENIVDLSFTVQWRINNARQYLFNVKDPEGTVKAVAESAMREVIGKTALQAILTNGRGQVQDATAALMQKILDQYGAGVTVVEVQIRSANPPAEVIAAFRDVANAGQDAQSSVNDAEAYRNRVVSEAKGDAAKMTEAAEGYREQVVLEAQGDAARFNAIYEQYRRSPKATRERLYLETMERVLAKSHKVIIDAKGATAPIVLPPSLFQSKAEAEADANDAAAQAQAPTQVPAQVTPQVAPQAAPSQSGAAQ